MTAQSAARKLPVRGLLILAAVLVVGTLVTMKVVHKKKAAVTVPTMPVERQDIVVTVEADGTIEPINVVDVRSKASGQIVQMPVDIGSVVKQGQLLVQVDPRDVRNQYNQTLAALKAAQVQDAVSQAEKKRSDDLHKEKVVTDQEHDAAVLTAENAHSNLVKARTDLDLARQRLEDATVRAPLSGTVIAKPVAVGQVISSATTSVGGGTSLLSMADLRQIRIRAMVNETDIGNVRPGEEATVVVDAYPDRPFRGTVEKVEPQAVVEQSVTEFPVLVSLTNEEGLLMPGMNGQVTVLVEQTNDVLAVPVDAVRSIRELPQAATALGLDPTKVREQMRSQRPAGAGGGSGGYGGGGGGAGVGGGGPTAGGNASGMAYGAPGQTGGGPGAQGGGGRGGWGRRGGAGADSAWGGQGGRGGWGGGGGWGGRQRGDSTFAHGRGIGGGFGGGGRDSTRAAGAGSRRGQPRVVFVQTDKGFEPRLVRLGVSNYDYAQIISGLKEGDRVALISAAQLQQQRQESLDRIKQRMGSGVPGMSQQGGGGGGRGGGGGGPRGGGG